MLFVLVIVPFVIIVFANTLNAFFALEVIVNVFKSNVIDVLISIVSVNDTSLNTVTTSPASASLIAATNVV